MEEDGGVKAPVTRLRRRLSVELSEDSKSPAGPQTPTKKRGGRLAAKPQLELIDENTPQNSPKKVTRRRSTARDLAETEEKPLTPSRRSTRVKSNTSVLAETPQAIDSPRAKRALRRNSQVGSDTEAPTPVTPARTRRGRKDSTTSLDKQATSANTTPVTPARVRRTRKNSASEPAENEEASKTTLITEVIAEEPENNLRKSLASNETSGEKEINGSPDSPRKSPRLMAKKKRKSKSGKELNDTLSQETDVNMNVSTGKTKLGIGILESNDNENALNSKQEDEIDGEPKARLSLSSANILNNMDEEPNKEPNMNKSTPSLLQIPSVFKTKRHRTKSWTTLATSSPKEGSFYSDNESTKKKIKNNAKLFTIRLSNQAGSGDSVLNANDNEITNISLERKEENYESKSFKSSTKKKRKESENDKSMKESTMNESNNLNKSTVQSPKPSKDNPEGDKENLDEQTSNNSAEFLFQKTPSNIQSILFIEDSDSNTESVGKPNKNTETEDQCVPEVVKNHEFPKHSESSSLNIPTENQLFGSLPTTANNDTCEPMDIDETMPENVSFKDHSGENKSVNESKDDSSRITSLCVPLDNSTNKSINKSKRKSKSNSVLQDHEKSDSGNKSTLVLSQIKDLSTADHNSSKTSNDSKQENKCLSTSIRPNNENVMEVINKNISITCLTSTPVQKSDAKKLAIQMNTSAITPHNESTKVLTEVKSNSEKIKVINKSIILSKQAGSGDSVINTNDGEKTNISLEEKEENCETKSFKNSTKKNRKESANDKSMKEFTMNESNNLTSTPVQKSDAKNPAIQMNTSAITPDNESTKVLKEVKSNSVKIKKNISMVSQSSQSDSSDAESDNENENSLVIDEAEDAGDDYESGDSQDEEERQYEKDHEIVDRGVTLTSDDEVSNDTDYEKDSFVVSSDEEDNDLLSGSGDDLDMSDNELTMSAKSKKKYDERLAKRQKKASREMFQARHGLDKCDQSSGSKITKTNRQRLDSTLLESGDDAVVPPKKKKRMRLESTMDSGKSDAEDIKSNPKKTTEVEEIRPKKKKIKRLSESMSEGGNDKKEELEPKNHSAAQDKSVSEEIGYKKKKSKRLSESICNESVMNEKEITAICDTTIMDDPLQVQIKQEPKTPQQNLDISTVHFTVREEIEQVRVDENVSIMKGNDTSDPLHATMAQDGDDDDSDYENSSISENEEITKNYDSILNKLNEKTKKKIKSVDISLDLNKKEKPKVKHAAVIEELNITQTKKMKSKKKGETTETAVIEELNITQTKKTKSKKKAEPTDTKSIFKRVPVTDDETSDSIDLRLMFSDDSNDGVKGSTAPQNKAETIEEFIPLKRTEGKTNLPGSLNASQIQANDTSLNTSSKKKNKRKSAQKENIIVTDVTEEQSLPFFVDTLGSHDETLNNSASTKKKNKKKNSIIVNGDLEVESKDKSKHGDSDNDAPAEVSYTSTKDKKSKKVSLSVEEDATNKSESTDQPANRLSFNKTPISERKNADQDGKSGKESSLIVMHNSLDNQIAAMENISEISNKKENKKRKRLSSAKDEVNEVTQKGDIPTAIVTNETNESLVSNSKKKRKLSNKSEDIGDIPTAIVTNEINELLVSNSKKKRKLSNKSEDIDLPGHHVSEKNDKTLSDKKKKPFEANDNKSAEKSRKRKERDDDVHDKKSKILKQNSSEKREVPRLPTSILELLEDKPTREIERKKAPKVVSTTQFHVEETRTRRNKPSNFLEESIYLNTDSESSNVQKKKMKVKPTVLPFTPTASISDSGFTTKFHITPIPQKMEFVAQRTEITNFKTEFLNARRSKKIRTELYKNQRNVKLSKHW